MHFTDIQTRALFPTPLFVATLPPETSGTINAELSALLLKKAASEPSAEITNIGGWQSDTRIVEWGGAPVRTVVDALRDLADQATLDIRGAGKKTDWKIYGWANVNRKGHMNMPHTHPGSQWSAVYYVQTDNSEGGAFQLIDPRGTLPITYCPQLRIGVEGFLSAGGHELHKPQAGQCLLFPSWLPHAVMPYKGEGVRISLAFNFSV